MVSCHRLILISLLSLALASCGFQLRGTYDLATGLSPLHIKTGEDALRQELSSLLRANDIKVASAAERYVSILKIDRATRGRRILSVDTRGRAREYELRFDLAYTLSYDIGKGAQQFNRRLRLTRELSFDPENVLAINEEIETLYDDMQRDAAQIIVRQMQAVN